MPTVLPSFKPTSLPYPEAQDSSSSTTTTIIDSAASSVLLLLIGVAVFVVGVGCCIVAAIHRRGWCHDLDKESPALGSVDTSELELELSELPKASAISLHHNASLADDMVFAEQDIVSSFEGDVSREVTISTMDGVQNLSALEEGFLNAAGDGGASGGTAVDNEKEGSKEGKGRKEGRK